MPRKLTTASHPDAGEALFAELVALYRELDALYEGWHCPGTTECCRFGITGRQPYVTSIELAWLERAIAARGGKLPTGDKRALPLTQDRERERICPLLDRAGRCSVYASRPLGCRSFYCERATKGAGPERDELRAVVQKLQELASRHRLGGELARPLVNALTQP